MLAAGQAHISTEELGLRGPRHRFQLGGCRWHRRSEGGQDDLSGRNGEPVIARASLETVSSSRVLLARASEMIVRARQHSDGCVARGARGTPGPGARLGCLGHVDLERDCNTAASTPSWATYAAALSDGDRPIVLADVPRGAGVPARFPRCCRSQSPTLAPGMGRGARMPRPGEKRWRDLVHAPASSARSGGPRPACLRRVMHGTSGHVY